jgi:hypothetical protein
VGGDNACAGFSGKAEGASFFCVGKNACTNFDGTAKDVMATCLGDNACCDFQGQLGERLPIKKSAVPALINQACFGERACHNFRGTLRGGTTMCVGTRACADTSKTFHVGLFEDDPVGFTTQLCLGENACAKASGFVLGKHACNGKQQ